MVGLTLYDKHPLIPRCQHNGQLLHVFGLVQGENPWENQHWGVAAMPGPTADNLSCLLTCFC